MLPAAAAPEEKEAARDLAHVWLVGTGEGGDGKAESGEGKAESGMRNAEGEGERKAESGKRKAEGGIVVRATEDEKEAAGANETGPWFFLGETELGKAEAPLPAGLDADGFRVLTLPGDRVILRGASPAGTEMAEAWFARQVLGARWFQPGDIGEDIPPLRGWKPPAIDRTVVPAFLSRSLEGGVGEIGNRKAESGEGKAESGKLKAEDEGTEWARRNGLHARLPHAHALLHVFPGTLFDAHPEWFPLRREVPGRYRPSSPDDYNWQPNLALPEVAGHAAEVADEFFDRNPGEQGFSLSENDSVHFDQSEETAASRGPLRWFRGRPDYSDLVFGFMNRAAEEVAKRHPDKLLSAYAYYWCENTPTFRVRANVIPWLTADRSQYYDRAFEREDHDLIERWCRSGARVVGIYDYLEGTPFLVPRQTAPMTAGAITFAYGAGVRAYTAEGAPNWGLDGPKLWIAAQLLWDPAQSVDALLDEYYGRFWREAAEPMRRFDALCDGAWREQPGPAWWLKYYDDESQAGLFPPKLRAQLRALIEEARGLARRPEVIARVERFSAAFGVTERFCAMNEAREALSNAAASETFERERGIALLGYYLERREAVEPAYERALDGGGVSRVDLWTYLRDDPASRAAIRLIAEAGPEAENVRARLASMQAVGASGGLGDALRIAGRAEAAAGLDDPDWRSLVSPGPLDDMTLGWSTAPWRGRGEPAEGRSIRISRDDSGRVVLRFDRAKAESLYQWVPATPGRIYRASVLFRGRVSPGNESLIIINWVDRLGHYLGQAATDQLPPGDWSKGRTLEVVGEAPADAAHVGVGLHVYNQTGRDYAEFSGVRLVVGGGK